MMALSLAELLLILAAVYVLYRLLKPLRVFLEKLILRGLDPRESEIIDVEPVKKTKKGKE